MTPQSNPPSGLVVVKVGGSLYDHPRLGPGLRAYLDQLDATKVLVVAGGGGFADVVRDLDRCHRLGEGRSHDLALMATGVAGFVLKGLLDLPDDCFTGRLDWWTHQRHRVGVLLADRLLKGYEEWVAPVPHTWELTTDSIAGYAAGVATARLVLLKSTDVPPGTPWEEAAARGWVDAHFPAVVREHRLRVEAVNFRRWLDAFPE
ncbi:MAG: hypothetical protein U0871_21300 [Gemmataceae bacterium]